MTKDQPKTMRCAIYTRKSTDENLDLEFNSLDAQRESGEAYIASQKSEGWVCLPDRYDDGGYSGGNMERPALKRLLADITAGKVNCIVVYKVDRLSRSLIDFSRIMETFDKNSVAFVSVTQLFNTANSMGRLMLNVLLSFAQFEREIVSERTRDKIAATRRKGKWTGGSPVLGYDIHAQGGRLLVNEAEAEKVRTIFQLYLQHEAIVPVLKELDARGWANKRWIKRDGLERGGRPFDKPSLYKLLTNVLYVGRLTYKTEVIKAEHPAVLADDVFHRVQGILQRNGRTGGAEVRNKYGALLRKVLVCGSCNCAMIHSYTAKDDNRRYRYYICLNAQKRGWHNCPTKSVSAPKIEEFVVEQIKRVVSDERLLRETLQKVRQQTQERVRVLEKERTELQRELKRDNGKIGRLAVQAAQGRPVAARLDDLQARVQTGERRLTAVSDELAGLGADGQNDGELAAAFRQFDPVWNVLSPGEQAKIVGLLVERVAYDGAQGKASVTFRPTGLDGLARRLAAKEA